jgi:hypothetical protein
VIPVYKNGVVGRETRDSERVVGYSEVGRKDDSWRRIVAYSGKCPSLAFGEVSNALAVVELPTDAQTPTHTRTLRHSFFQTIGATREALITAHSSHQLSSFWLLFSFFLPIPSFPQRNFAPGSPRNDDRQLGQLTTSPVLSLLMRISLSQSRSLPSSDCLQRKSCPSLICAVPPSLLFHLPPPTDSGSGVRAGLLIKTRKDMSSVPATPG